jgi:hypothetical protein
MPAPRDREGACETVLSADEEHGIGGAGRGHRHRYAGTATMAAVVV